MPFPRGSGIHRAMKPGLSSSARLVALLLLLSLPGPLSQATDVNWQHATSKNGDLPVPGESTQQTGNLIVDLDKDGVKDFVISFRVKGPALVWYRRTAKGW